MKNENQASVFVRIAVATRIATSMVMALGVFGGCVTSRPSPPVTLKSLPPDRCFAKFGKQARETMMNGGTSCVIYFANTEMKLAERKYAASVAGLSSLKISEAKKKLKSDQLIAVWFREASEAASKASCPPGMRKAADFPASSVTCTASLEVTAPTRTSN